MPDLPEALKKAASQGLLIPFVGAGVSMSVRRPDGQPAFPSWDRLLQRAAERLRQELKPGEADRVLAELKRPDYLEAAKIAKAGLGSVWLPFLVEALTVERSTVNPDSLALARALWELGSPLIITTNYDRVLEWACPKEGDVQRWNIQSEAGLAGALRNQLHAPTVWHLHGSLDHINDVILTPDGYEALYPPGVQGRYTAALTALRNMLVARTFLFTGFSFEDPALVRQVKWVHDTFDGCGGPHYVLVRAAEVDRVKSKLQGVNSIEILSFAEFGKPLVERVQAITRVASASRASPSAPTPGLVATSTELPPVEAIPRSVSFFLTCASDIPEERELAQRLESDLTREKHKVFNDSSARWGQRSTEEIDSRIARSDFLVVLLSETSSRSEYVLEALRRARSHLRARGRPRLLAVRVRYEDAMPYELSAFLPEWQRWRSESDSAGLVQALLDVAQGKEVAPKTDAPEATAPANAPALAAEIRPPEPAADLRAVMPGAPLPTNDRFYIEREPDAMADTIARGPSHTLVLKAPPQFGKSSLLRRYLESCRKANKVVALVDLGLFSDQELENYPIFLSRLAVEIARKLRLNIFAPAQLSQLELRNLFEDQILGAVRNPVVLALDRIDRVFGQSHELTFFSMLRAWHDNRAFDETWEQLSMVFVLSTESNLRVPDPYRSPWQNVGITLDIEAFSEEECQALNLRHPRPLENEQVRKLWNLLGGHPYLTRLAYFFLANHPRLTLDELTSGAPGDGPFGDHLRALHFKLMEHPERKLLEAMKQVIRHGTTPDEITHHRLVGAGLCRKEPTGRIIPSNQLYAWYFGNRS